MEELIHILETRAHETASEGDKATYVANELGDADGSSRSRRHGG